MSRNWQQYPPSHPIGVLSVSSSEMQIAKPVMKSEFIKRGGKGRKKRRNEEKEEEEEEKRKEKCIPSTALNLDDRAKNDLHFEFRRNG
ncbi:hypothetical protein HZU73_07544 [Apis mellifera caucasica]|nr:hypothetical protein HZU73_07544 [Apis mellifera caucasica]